MQPATTDETPPAREPAPEPASEPSRECGWFGSSHELREGLEVMEFSVGLLGAAWTEQASERGATPA